MPRWDSRETGPTPHGGTGRDRASRSRETSSRVRKSWRGCLPTSRIFRHGGEPRRATPVGPRSRRPGGRRYAVRAADGAVILPGRREADRSARGSIRALDCSWTAPWRGESGDPPARDVRQNQNLEVAICPSLAPAAFHTDRSAAMGSMPAARRAGRYPATVATVVRTMSMARNVAL